MQRSIVVILLLKAHHHEIANLKDEELEEAMRKLNKEEENEKGATNKRKP